MTTLTDEKLKALSTDFARKLRDHATEALEHLPLDPMVVAGIFTGVGIDLASDAVGSAEAVKNLRNIADLVEQDMHEKLH